uniref:Uncharacterized protein n=1 Tax=Ascaris lumbricoides TaxID=6252 RepID=A0A9J2PFI3_ASCLU
MANSRNSKAFLLLLKEMNFQSFAKLDFKFPTPVLGFSGVIIVYFPILVYIPEILNDGSFLFLFPNSFSTHATGLFTTLPTAAIEYSKINLGRCQHCNSVFSVIRIQSCDL